jgi:hypothetical protein
VSAEELPLKINFKIQTCESPLAFKTGSAHFISLGSIIELSSKEIESNPPSVTKANWKHDMIHKDHHHHAITESHF